MHISDKLSTGVRCGPEAMSIQVWPARVRHVVTQTEGGAAFIVHSLLASAQSSPTVIHELHNSRTPKLHLLPTQVHGSTLPGTVRTR
jgi:hypothetical protein